MIRSKQGGSVIGEGGFGCVFKPALKCKTQSTRTQGISKLLLTKDAREEYKLLKSIESKVKRIKNNDKYYLLYELSLCDPDTLTEQDMERIDEKCTLFTESKSAPKSATQLAPKSATQLAPKSATQLATKANINDKLSKLKIINMPYGGIELTYLLENIQYDSIFLNQLNTNISSLLKNGIIPLNKQKIYHTDIKSPNILVHEQDGLPRLIDWGSALIDDGDLLAEDGRPMQFNQPLSIVLLNKSFLKAYHNFLREKSINNLASVDAKSQFRSNFFPKFYQAFLKKNAGHHSYMAHMYNTILYNSNLTQSEANSKFIQLVTAYVIKILEVYTKNGKFNIDDYFTNIFLKTTDIWGLVSCYDQMPQLIARSTIDIQDKIYLIEKIRKLFVELLISPTKVVNTNKIVNILETMHVIGKNKKSTNNRTNNKTRKRKSN